MSPLQVAGAMVGLIGGVLGIAVVLAKVGQYVLFSFHNEHVQPAITHVTAAIEKNTTATDNVAKALSKTETDTHATFNRMGKIIEDHEERITALEPQPAPAAMRVVRKRRTS